ALCLKDEFIRSGYDLKEVNIVYVAKHPYFILQVSKRGDIEASEFVFSAETGNIAEKEVIRHVDALKTILSGVEFGSDLYVEGRTVARLKIIPDMAQNFSMLLTINSSDLIVTNFYFFKAANSRSGDAFEIPDEAGIITEDIEDIFPHAYRRAIARHIPYAHAPGADITELLSQEGVDGTWVIFEVVDGTDGLKVNLRLATVEEIKNREIPGAGFVVGIPEANLEFDSKVVAPEELYSLSREELLGIIGPKAANLAELKRMNRPEIEVPDFMALTFSAYDKIINKNPNLILTKYESMIFDEEGESVRELIEGACHFSSQHDGISLRGKLEMLRALIEQAEIPPEYREEILALVKAKFLDKGIRWGIFRTSTNAEDLDQYPGVGAGLYGSYYPVDLTDEDAIFKAIKQCWASMWTERAFQDREFFNIDQFKAMAGVIIQEFIPGDYSFVINTARSAKEDTLEFGVVQGLAPVLVLKNIELRDELPDLAFQNIDMEDKRPHTFIYNRDSGELFRDAYSGKKIRLVFNTTTGKIDVMPVDNASDIFSLDNIPDLAMQIANIGVILHKYFGIAQDIEGVIKIDPVTGKPRIYVVQSRALPLP
ncbi:MAG: hypothetical protein NTZ48_00450, partial [Candidatus Omnitrophica bacterium]|nr:hypothetical protein [Candidatus Omnitrophota bacterium]